MVRLEIIVGSVRDGRFAPAVADWFTARARDHGGFDVGVIDLADTGLRDDLADTPAAQAYRARLADAEAFAVVTAEYNHGYPGALKTALDTAKHEWRAKPVGFVSYGGMSGGLRAVEQLRQVVAELHMVSVRDTVSFHHPRKGDGLNAPATTDAATRLLTQLHWWASALTPARGSYPG